MVLASACLAVVPKLPKAWICSSANPSCPMPVSGSPSHPIWQDASPEGKSAWSVFSPTCHLPTLVAERRRERLLTPSSDPALSTVSWIWSSWGDRRSAAGARKSERNHVNRLLPPCLSGEWWACDTVEGARVLTWKMLREACHGSLSADKMCLRYPRSTVKYIRVIFLVVPNSEAKLLSWFIVGEWAALRAQRGGSEVIFQHGITLLYLWKDWMGRWRWGFNSAILPWSIGLIPN